MAITILPLLNIGGMQLFRMESSDTTQKILPRAREITTTGSTIITNLDNAPKGILMWRAILQWLGGIGVIVMAITILPLLNIGGMQLFRMESSDTTEKILPRTREVTLIISVSYTHLTLPTILLV